MSYASEVLADSPLAYFRLGESSGSTMVDASGNGRNGSYFGSPTLGVTGLLTGDPDKAATFSGSGQYGLVPSGSWMDFTAGVTFEAVIKPTAVSGNYNIISRDDGSHNYRMRISGGKLQLLFYPSTGGVGLSSSASLTAGVTYHVAITWDFTNVRFYINGVLDSTQARGGTMTHAAAPLTVGALTTGGSEAFAGTIDEAAYYGAALSTTRIAAHYTAATTAPDLPPITGPVAATLPAISAQSTGVVVGASEPYSGQVLADAPLAYYRLGESSGTTMVDSSGNARNGAYTGMTLGATGAIADGNTAATLSGTTSRGLTPGAAWMDQATWSVEMWARLSTDVTTEPVFASRVYQPGLSADPGWVWMVDSNTAGQVRCRLYNGGVGGLTSPTGIMFDNLWHHIVATFDGTTARLYLDGSLATSTAYSPRRNATSDFVVGNSRSPASDDFQHGSSSSQVDEVAFYAGALPASRILAHYNAASIAPPSGLTGTVSGSLPSLTAAASGTVSAPPATGTVAASLPALTASVTGTHSSNDQVGTVAATLPSLQGSVAGDYTPAMVTGDAVATLPALTGEAFGSVSTIGTVAATLPSLEVAVNDGSGDASGSIAASLPALSGGVVGSVANGILVLADDANQTVLDIDTPALELDLIPPLAVPPPSLAGRERRVVRRSVAVPSLKSIAGVTVDPTTGQPRIPRDVWDSLPLAAPEQDLGTLHILFPDNDVTHDITYFRGGITQVRSIRREEPFGDASAVVEIPLLTSMDDEPVEGDDLFWSVNRANIEIVLAHPTNGVTRLFVGHVVSHDIGNNGSTPVRVLTCVGSMRQASTDVHKPPTFQDPLDIGYLISRSLNSVTSHRYPSFPSVATGILSRNRGAWSDNPLSYCQQLLSTAWTSDGNQWTIAKVPGTRRQYELRLKATVPTVTITNGAFGVDVDLSRDMTSVRNVIYGHGVGSDGYTWYNYKYPGMHLDDAPGYPFSNPANVISVGTTDAATTSGTGVTDWQRRVRDLGYRISIDGVFNSSDADIARAVQRKFGIQVDGAVGPQTWNATFGVGSNVGDLTDPKRLPLAADPATQKWLFNADGSVAGENPDYNVNVIAFADDVDFGTGITRAQGIASAQQILEREAEPGLVGRITIATDPREKSRFLINEGEKMTLVGFEGKDRVLHITAVDLDLFSGTVTLEVDEKSRDAMTQAQIVARNREARRDPARRPGNPNRRSRQEIDQIVPFDGESGAGRIPRMALYGGLWTVARIPVSEAGKVAVLDMTTSGPASEFCVAFFGNAITPAHLVEYVGNPLSDKSGWTRNREVLEDRFGWLEGVGSPDQPAGYFGGLKSEGDPLTGRLKDTGGFEYVSARPPWIWMAVWSPSSTFIEGRILPAVVV